ncbi:hypothetical protein [Aestuariivivens insulae]|uniref:hypothetical protein n=1 Tax=Aestuariivivens insulae TaxID=1621988 RepID=UPI001F56D07E|nr:hypothetical protein [Aestuariivivens insulae]
MYKTIIGFGVKKFIGLSKTIRLPKVIKAIKEYIMPEPIPNKKQFKVKDSKSVIKPTEVPFMGCLLTQFSNPKCVFNSTFLEVL